MSIMVSSGTRMPSTAQIFSGVVVMTLRSAERPSVQSKLRVVMSPQSSCWIRCRARARPSLGELKSTPFSYRAEESLDCPRARLVLRTESRAKVAHSNSRLWVLSSIPELAPPMTPASATGFSASQMTRLFSVRVNSFSSRVTIFSPGRARRTSMQRPATLSRSKACIGWPISSRVWLVMSTTLLMDRRPQRAR